MKIRYLIFLLPLFACSLFTTDDKIVTRSVQATLLAENLQVRTINSTLQAENSYLRNLVAASMAQPVPVTGSPPAQRTTEPGLYSEKTDGYYLVNKEISPGTWRTETGHQDCYWSLTDSSGNFLDGSFGMSGGVVIIPETAFQLRVQNCGIIRFLQR
jgi:hypothetical protein